MNSWLLFIATNEDLTNVIFDILTNINKWYQTSCTLFSNYAEVLRIRIRVSIHVISQEMRLVGLEKMLKFPLQKTVMYMVFEISKSNMLGLQGIPKTLQLFMLRCYMTDTLFFDIAWSELSFILSKFFNLGMGRALLHHSPALYLSYSTTHI